MEEISRKALPIGVEEFDDMIKDYYYVDKTLLIKDILDKKGKVNLFTRPRRFGKSLNISMLQHFFDNLMADQAHLFNGLDISKVSDNYLSHQNNYPVIKLGLKDVEGASFASAMKMMVTEIANEYDRHAYLLESSQLRKKEKEVFEKILDKEVALEDYKDGLRFLSRCLEKHYSKKVIILIDEYDVPLEKSHFEGYYPEMVTFIRGFFSAALKTNKSLHFSVITGCLRVSKESIFTGLNNLNVISITSGNYGEYFGFTEDEVEQMLTYYELTHKGDEMRAWYNGYVFGNKVVYNPWSSIKYLSDMLYAEVDLPFPHWSNTSSNAIVQDLITISDHHVKEEIEALIAGHTITKPIKEDIVYADILKNMDNLWSFLFFTGYLKAVSKSQIDVQTYIELAIPNKEILYIYQTKWIEWFDELVKTTDLTHLYRAVLAGDTPTFQHELSDMLKKTISYLDSQEAFYHGFLAAVMSTLSDYVTKSNRESGNGRSDLFMRPVSIRQPAVVIEVKVAKEAKDLTSQCERALAQIEAQKYEDELRRDGYTNVIKYGIAFYRKNCEIKLSK